jgi:hypothetical protein
MIFFMGENTPPSSAYTTPRKPNNFTENLIPKRVKLDDK